MALAKRLKFLTRSDVSEVPYGEICLPGLAKAGWQIEVVAPGATRSLLASVRPFKRQAHDLPDAGLRREIAMFGRLIQSRISGHSVIYIHSQSLSARAYIALFGPNFGKRLVYHNPDYYDPFEHRLYHYLEKKLCRKIDLYLNNEFHRAYITRAAYRIRCPIVTIPIMLPSVWPFPKPDLRIRDEMCGGALKESFVLILHGGYSEIRMVPELFRALATLPKHVRLVMFDRDHRRKEVDDELAALGLGNRVVRYPRMNVLELAKYTVNADAGVLLYQNNDLGNFFTAPGRLTEYVGAGIPVLASNHTGLENLVWKYRLGITVDSTKSDRIAGGIRELVGLKQGGVFPVRLLKQTFLDYLAFDHWEPDVIAKFEALLNGSHLSLGRAPTFPWLIERR